MRLGHQLSVRDKGMLCPDCKELLTGRVGDRLACRFCGQVDTVEGWAVGLVLRVFPGAELVDG